VTHNALSRSMNTVPMWIVQAAVGILLTSGVAWATWASVSSWKQESRISVMETKVDGVKDDIKDIKDGQKEINQKLDRMLERRSDRSERPVPSHPLYGRDDHGLNDGR
jgi:hypothetical protein